MDHIELAIAALCIHGQPVPSKAGIAIQQASHIVRDLNTTYKRLLTINLSII